MSEDHEARVRKAVETASAIVKALPESIQPAAFNKAFDALMLGGNGAATRGADRPALVTESKRSSRPRSSGGGGAAETSSDAGTLIRDLNRTEHPEIRDGRKALDLALYMLRAGRRDCKVEWLTPSEIGSVLRSKFMLKIDSAAIRMALGASDYVDRRPKGKAYEYRLMAPGETYLEKLDEENKTKAHKK